MNSNDAIALLDCNNFFVSCERRVNPSLNDRPVVVLSNNDGCIISRSNEVRKMGVPMAAPLFEYRELLEKNNTAIISCNHTLYTEVAHQVMETLKKDVGENSIEVYSIDEAFINVGVPDKLELFGNHIKDKVLKKAKVPVSVGIAETKTLAKISNRIAKNSAKANGMLSLYHSPYTDYALEKTKVWDIWGIGSKNARRLQNLNINTALDLKNSEPELVRRNLNVFGARTVLELRGIKSLPLEIAHKDKKSIAYTRTFGHRISSYFELKNALIYFATRAVEKMRKDGLAAKSVSCFIKTNRFNKNSTYYSNAFTAELIYATNVKNEILKWIPVCLDNIFRPDLEFRQAGVILGSLISLKEIPLRLFGQEKFHQWQQVESVVDEINYRYGRDFIRLASFKEDGHWLSNSTHLFNEENHAYARKDLGMKVSVSSFRFL